MGWSCKDCTELHPEDHLQCSCGQTRQETDYDTAVSVATAVADNSVDRAVIRNAIVAALDARDVNVAVDDNDVDNDSDDEDDDSLGQQLESQTLFVRRQKRARAVAREDVNNNHDSDDDEEGHQLARRNRIVAAFAPNDRGVNIAVASVGVAGNNDHDGDDNPQGLNEHLMKDDGNNAAATVYAAVAPEEDAEDEAELSAQMIVPAHLLDIQTGRVWAETHDELNKVDIAYGVKLRLKKEEGGEAVIDDNSPAAAAAASANERMHALPDSQIDPVTHEPPSKGCRFLCPDEGNRVNRQVFEMKMLITYIQIHSSEMTHVRHPTANIWCHWADFPRYIEEVTDEEQELFTKCRVSSGLDAVDHQVSVDQIKFIYGSHR